MKTKKYELLFRFPRIFSILFILFISIFALDVFDMGLNFRQTMGALFMHLIPTRFMIIALILSRKRYPLVGTIVFGGFGFRYLVTSIIRFFMSLGGAEGPAYYYLIRPITIALPPLVVGFLFFRYRRLRKQGKIAK